MTYRLTCRLGQLATLLSLLGQAAIAQQRRPDLLVKIIDADSDGTISAAELSSAATAIRKLDTQ